jgi:dTDP-4-dehydrorhamnose reductase
MRFINIEKLNAYLGAQMKHVILGAGNLGKDLEHELSSQGHGAVLLSKSEGLNFKDLITFDTVKDLAPDVVWVSVGGGSVPEAKLDSKSYETAKYLNQTFPITLNYDLPATTRIIFFSTDYCADERTPSNPESYTSNPRSEYAKQKIEMENKILGSNTPNRAIIRVGSLYGFHKPWKTFPGKILNNKERRPLSLPQNLVTPTPTRWLAFTLANSLDVLFSEEGTRIHHCAPEGNVSVANLGRHILSHSEVIPREDKEKFDNERPHISQLGCSFVEVDHWLELWNVYFKKDDFT